MSHSTFWDDYCFNTCRCPKIIKINIIKQAMVCRINTTRSVIDEEENVFGTLFSIQPNINIHKNEKETLGIFVFLIVNQLVIPSAIVQPAPSPRPSSRLWGEKIHMSSLYTSHRQFAYSPKDKYQDQKALIRSKQKYNSTIN